MTPETDELDDLLDQSLANPKPARDSQDADAPDGFDELEGLLAESMSAVRESREAKEARERTKRGGQSAAELLADRERIKAWEAKHEWVAVANVGMFIEHTCDCGGVTQNFEAIMQRQKHRHLRDSFRWQAAQTTLAALPNEVVVRRRFVPVCALCAEGKGWLMEGAVAWEA